MLSHDDYALLETSYSMSPQNLLINFSGAAIQPQKYVLNFEEN